MFFSPLRYPGGKSKLTAYVLETMKLNNLEGAAYVEPFAGGCAIAWYLLLKGHASKVYINDLDPAIHAFWYSVLYKTDELCQLIQSTPITIEEWYKQRELYRDRPNDYLMLGFATFFLNRTNRSGIIKAGVIGGLEQNGAYKLDCRFNKDRLIKQIRAIAERRDDIRLTNLDATQFIEEYIPDIDGPAFVNIDPPYYVKGKGLYQNFFEHEDHYRLYESIKRLRQPWIVTYDDTPEICGIYAEYSPESFGLTYTAQTKCKGSEIIIHSPNIEKTGFKPDVTFAEIKKYHKLSEAKTTV
ncbi:MULTISPECIES: DNA adenine methylase [Pseudoalteromonas]|uniref:site-specific DNA-methyltransferase (adenine-specific) n=1 Tax=Pseudoalteromonas amylolytica TaxID=1859457 RepID=A0A1S1MZJ5_9GAMM|nr:MULTISPECIES: DNA adenine methylase [Pseudoalteromonas]OHU91848.1 DNA methyltransferase [Pseudoalteromonas sp. JW3]OHU93174.1 DNA methyltransferase [Pseudoalteromonas amylolytica]